MCLVGGHQSLEFQSTHPARGATYAEFACIEFKPISIHAPREGCDVANDSTAAAISYFNPRTPRGVRHLSDGIAIFGLKFQSTHPARGATELNETFLINQCDFNPRTPRGVRRSSTCPPVQIPVISIHAPREGCDHLCLVGGHQSLEFQSTHPARGATPCLNIQVFPIVFQSTHPARGATSSF